MCTQYITGSDIRVKTARIFAGLQSDVPSAVQTTMSVDVCEVISVLEAATCSEAAGCFRTTSVKAECYSQHAPVIKFGILAFVSLIFAGIVFGFTKNYIPSLQEFNMRHFNY